MWNPTLDHWMIWISCPPPPNWLRIPHGHKLLILFYFNSCLFLQGSVLCDFSSAHSCLLRSSIIAYYHRWYTQERTATSATMRSDRKCGNNLPVTTPRWSKCQGEMNARYWYYVCPLIVGKILDILMMSILIRIWLNL